MSLVASTRSRDPREIERAALFNRSHSSEAFFANVELAFVASAPLPHSSRPVSGVARLAMVGWEGRPTEAAPVLLNLDEPSELEATLGLIRDVSPEDVVLARPRGLPRQVLDALQALKYSFEIPGTRDRTLEGWQDETEAEARAWAALRPTSDPTMGLLSKPGCTAGQAPALVLSTVNDQWFVQTEYGAHGLVGGAQLLRGTSVFFVAANTFDLFELVPLGRADRNTIGREWGLAAVDRTNPAGSGIIVDLKQRR